MATDDRQGPLTAQDLLAVWVATTDDAYNQAFTAAGEGGGLEAYTQGHAQLARVSQAIDVSTQSIYILPWSGQTNPPATGENRAAVTLAFARTRRVEQAVRLGAGLVFYEELANDWGESGGVPVLTGRRYTLVQDLVLYPGDLGPVAAAAVAEGPGWGYNNPLPGTIQVLSQVGSGFYHDRGTLTVTLGGARYASAAGVPAILPPPAMVVTLSTVNEADTFVPDHVGQYVIFTAGANVGKVARVLTFAAPDPAANAGSSVTLEPLAVVESFSAAGTYTPGEQVVVKSGATVVGYGTFVGQEAAHTAGHSLLALVLLSGTVSVGNTVTSTAEAVPVVTTVGSVLVNPQFVAEAPPPTFPPGSGANWQVLDWAGDLGLTVTNPASPAGGTLGTLDAIGDERNLPRLTGEPDATYRARLHQVADVVTPNAVRRALNRAMGNIPWCFREVGSLLYPGFYYDRFDEGGDFYDDDAILFAGHFVGLARFVDPGAPYGFQERVEFRDALGNVKAKGYFGRFDQTPGTGYGFAWGALPAGSPNDPHGAYDATGWEFGAYDGEVPGQLTVIRQDGQGTLANPVVVAAGDVVVGLSSGAVYRVSGTVADPYNASTRFRQYLDVTDMRAMFAVGVPRLGFGEYGYAYDAGPSNAYDLPGENAYDGFPAGAATFYKRVYDALQQVKAAGVTVHLYLEDGSCA